MMPFVEMLSVFLYVRVWVVGAGGQGRCCQTHGIGD